MNFPPSGHHDLARTSLFRIIGAVILVTFLWHTRALSQTLPAKTPEAFGKVYHCKPGPWGHLEYYSIYLEMPDHSVELFPRPDPTPRWSFAGGTEAGLRSLFESAGLSRAFQEDMLASTHRVLKDNVLTVFPPLPGLIAMTPVQRAIIYRELAKCDFNPYHVDPICIANGDPDSWFAPTGLRPELREVVKKMTYMRGEVLCFSDLAAVFGMVKFDKEARDVFKAMSRTRTLVLRLNVKTGSNLDQVMRYWSGNNRNTEIEPILLSAAETEGMERLDCVHLLPPLARRYLYCYPSADLAMLPDCHWTSLNFFNSTPINYQLDTRSFAMYLKDYVPVEPPYSFGDVLMYVTPSSEALHSCVYIADDIVYTKNGETLAAPWLLMKMGDVKRFYSYGQQISVRGYRLKSQGEPAGGN